MKIFSLLTALVALLLFSGCQTQPATTVYLIRHAEKDLTNPQDKNPPLTKEGYQRSLRLAKLLKDEKITAVLSTEYLRTMSTVQPLAQQAGVTVTPYPPTNYQQVKEVISQHPGKTVVICGHSDTILPMIKALGAQPPVGSISDTTYSNLFKVVLSPGGEATATVTAY